MRHPVARRSLGRGPAGPGAKASVRAGTRAHGTTSPTPPHAGDRAAAPERKPLTEAQILVGTTSWLVDLRDRLAEQLDLAEGTTLAMPRATLEAMRDGLTRCAGWLDTLTVDPAQLPPAETASAAPIPPAPNRRTLQ